jgi:hypothetical protein
MEPERMLVGARRALLVAAVRQHQGRVRVHDQQLGLGVGTDPPRTGPRAPGRPAAGPAHKRPGRSARRPARRSGSRPPGRTARAGRAGRPAPAATPRRHGRPPRCRRW